METRTIDIDEIITADAFLKERDDYIEARITMKQEGTVLTTIPVDSGWSVYVDGEKTEQGKWLDTYIQFDVDAGDHEVVLQYTLPGLYLGLMVTAVTGSAVIVSRKLKNVLANRKQRKS